MLGAIQCLEQAYGKGFLSSYTRARISSLKAQGSAPQNARTTPWRGMTTSTTMSPRLTARRRERPAVVTDSVSFLYTREFY